MVSIKLNEFEYCQAELGGLESSNSLATKRLEYSSIELIDTSFREAAGVIKTFGGDLVEVHEERKYVITKLMSLNIVRLNLEELNQEIP